MGASAGFNIDYCKYFEDMVIEEMYLSKLCISSCLLKFSFLKHYVLLP